MNKITKYQFYNALILLIGLSVFYGCGEDEMTYTAPLIPLVTADYDFDQFGGNGTIVMDESVGSVSASCDRTWISALKVDGSTVSFTVAPNTSIRSRVAEIKLTSEQDASSTVVVTQSSAMFTNQEEYFIDSEGGDHLLKMPTELEYTYTIDPDAAWITSSKIEKDGLSLTVEPSPSTQPRSATVTLASTLGRKDKTFVVTQVGYDFGIFPQSATFGFEGGTQKVVVSGKRSFSVSFDAPWLSFEKNEEGGVFTAASNENGNERTATVTFKDDKYGATTSFQITQDPDPAEYEDYLGEWEIIGEKNAKYRVVLSEKEKGKTFNMTSESWPGLAIEVGWSSDYNGRRLTIIAHQLITNPDGTILLIMPAYENDRGGVTFGTAIGKAAAYFKFDGVDTIICDGGTDSQYNGFILYNRKADNSGNAGWYKGGPNQFTGTVLTKIP